MQLAGWTSSIFVPIRFYMVLGCWRVPLGFNLHLCWELLVIELTLIGKSRTVVERWQKKRKKEISTWPPPVSKLTISHDGVVTFVLVLSLGENPVYWASPAVLMISPNTHHGIPPMNSAPPLCLGHPICVLIISPDVLNTPLQSHSPCILDIHCKSLKTYWEMFSWFEKHILKSRKY